MKHSVPAIVLSTMAIVSLIASCSDSGNPTADTEIAEFIGLQPEGIDWTPEPDGGGILVAILVGDPNEHGPLVARYDIPPNMEIEAHTHREVRGYTVISGVWELGFGEEFDSRKLKAYPQGSYYRLPADVPHFQRAGPQGAVIQIESIGPDTFDPVK